MAREILWVSRNPAEARAQALNAARVAVLVPRFRVPPNSAISTLTLTL